MPELEGLNPIGAWQLASRYIIREGGEAYHLVTTIADPLAVRAADLTTFDPRSFPSGFDNINDVINTIFPEKLARKFVTRQEFYDAYLERHDRARKYVRNRGAWGTYFERLIRIGDNRINQLEDVINKLSTWNPRATAALVLHPSSPIIDSPRKRGGPCWHFGEFLWHANNVVDLAVVYRNHDFFNKALGNFVALGCLLGFVCHNSHKIPGKVVCHSMRAYHGGSKNDFRRMVGVEA